MEKECPLKSTYDVVFCSVENCAIWDMERDCCSFSTKTLVINTYERAAVSRIKDRLKVEMLRVLEAKPGWGKNELKNVLFDLVDGLKDESSL